MTLSRRAWALCESLGIGTVGAFAVVTDRWLLLAVGATGVAGALLALAQPLHALLAWVFLAPEVMPYVQLPLPAGIPDLTFPRIGAGLVAGSLLLSSLFGGRKLAPIGVVEIAMLAFLTILYVDTVARGDEPASEALITFDEYALPFLLYYLAKNLFLSERDGKKFFYVMAALGLLLAIHGIYQYVSYGAAGSGQAELPADEFVKERGHILEGRAAGPFTNGMTYGGAVSLALLWALFLLFYYSRGLGRLLLAAAIGFMLLAAFLSLTRAVWLGLVLAFLTIAAFDRRWRRPILVSLGGAFALGVLLWMMIPSDLSRIESRAMASDTIYQRIVMYRAAVSMILENPLVGYGRGERRFIEGRQKHLEPVGAIPADMGNMAGPPHNIYLYTLVQWGLVGLLTYLSVFGTLIRSALRLRRVSRTVESYPYRFAAFFLASTILYMSYGMFVDSVVLPFLAATYFIGAGILASLHQGGWPGQRAET